MTKIAIIGAGLSGRLVALHLLRIASPVDGITIFDREGPGYLGPAYLNDADDFLLNVPAARMSALPEDPEHFLRWVRSRGICAKSYDFLPRRLYRNYILEFLRETERAAALKCAHVRGEVTDVELCRDHAFVHIGRGQRFAADKVVLALGNFPPGDPPIANRAVLQSRRYVGNPWHRSVLDQVARADTVFLIGTGQTTVDLALGLERRGHVGRIIAMSRRGLLPLPHRAFEDYPSFLGEIKETRKILDMFRIVRKHLKHAQARGQDVRSVIDSLRPDTQSLWFNLPEVEKRRFLRHVFRYWEIIRSRLPPQSITVVEAMRASSRLEVIAGRMRGLVETEMGLEVHYAARGEATARVQLADLVINCIGPETDCRKIDHVLITNLLRRGSIRPGPANLGIDCLPNGAILDSASTPSSVLYTLGSTMRGVLWEVLAVPDIRGQAQRLAETLLERGGIPSPSCYGI